MKLFLLFLAPVLYGQVPGLVTVQAGALSCGAVMRSATTIQTYCYAPGLVVVHNALNTVSAEAIDDYHWCVGQTGCTTAAITWDFKIVPTGIAWQYTIDASTIISGTLTKVYGSP
jgi:hypothetical protein